MASDLAAALDDSARKRLVAYAHRLISVREWPGETDTRELAKDITSDAICKTLMGERHWDSTTNPDPIKFLASVIKSLVYAHRQNLQNRRQLVFAEEPGFEELEDFAKSPHDNAESEEFFYGLMCELGDDDECAKMLDLFEKGYKPEEIANELGMTRAQVYAAKKRLYRKTRAYLQKRQVVT